jgi:hypothetical protein
MPEEKSVANSKKELWLTKLNQLVPQPQTPSGHSVLMLPEKAESIVSLSKDAADVAPETRLTYSP